MMTEIFSIVHQSRSGMQELSLLLFHCLSFFLHMLWGIIYYVSLRLFFVFVYFYPHKYILQMYKKYILIVF